VDLSGVIFVVLALAWAVYLIPKAVKHHDEVARSRSVDRFSTAMRVLARREPVSRRDARLVVTPARPAEATRMVVPSSVSRSAPPPPAAARPQTPHQPAGQAGSRRVSALRHAAARGAARRRRRVLYLLLLAGAVVIGLAAAALAPWWSVTVPSALVAAFLMLCRRAVRRARDDAWDRAIVAGTAETAAARAAEVPPRRAIRLDTPSGGARAASTVHAQESRNAQGFAEFSADEETVAVPTAALRDGLSRHPDHETFGADEVEAVAVAVPTVDGGSLWDPLPVTLPTYVGKAKAARTVRTIDLGEPDTWTSGRDDADRRLVEETAAAQDQDHGDTAPDQQRAVGS
jgi:hypothetical protein